MIKRFLIALAATCAAGGALAQTNIGEVADVYREVTGAFGGRTLPLRNSDAVRQNEVISTGVQSTARIAFHDLSNLDLAPQSSVVLDRFVYNPDSSGRQVTLRLTKGAFRFISGRTKSENIRLRTPQATIGVRGTSLGIWVRSGREIVLLKQGAVRVCKGATCVDLVTPETGVVITAAGIQGPTAAVGDEFNFDAMALDRFPFGGNPALRLPGAGLGSPPASSSRP